MADWSERQMPRQDGRVAVVTGASGGLGHAVAEALAGAGARIVLAVRDTGRGEATRERIAARNPRASVEVRQLDLAVLASVRAFTERAAGDLGQVDLLVNNAGLGLQSRRATTADGFERQFGTNHLGHFALTALLMPALLAAQAPRVVAVSSIAHRRAAIGFDDLQGERRYSGTRAYGQSKLANLMFAIELDRRARAAGSRLVSVAAHPGIAATGFIAATGMPLPLAAVVNRGVGLVGQGAAAGAWPILYAATMPEVAGGSYWGPDGVLEVRGGPEPAAVSRAARDAVAAARLWRVSEELTGVRFPALG